MSHHKPDPIHPRPRRSTAKSKTLPGNAAKPQEQLPVQPAQDDREGWKTHWEAHQQPWRTEPEITLERQQQLEHQRAIDPDSEKGIYPFRELKPKLTRADIEWLLATHDGGRGPVDWNTEKERQGLDLRGADLHQVDLHGLPLTRLYGGIELDKWVHSIINGSKLTPMILTKANLEGANLEGANLIGVNLEGANLEGANLEEAYIIHAKLNEADLSGAQLKKASLQGAELKEANLESANLESCVLIGANLENAELINAILTDAFLDGANLKRSGLMYVHMERASLRDVRLNEAQLFGTYIEGVDLRHANLEGAGLEDIYLVNQHHVGPRLADIHWGSVNLSVVEWAQITVLGDEYIAHLKLNRDGEKKDKKQRLYDYQGSVRANRQLAVVLQSQGLNEEAARFAYRAQVCQRRVFWYQGWHSRGKWLGSWFLSLLAGYGYRFERTLGWYLLAIASFTFGYYVVTHLLHAQPYPLAWYEALILSVSAFHGRGFFQPVQSLGDPVAILAAIEAVIGLLIEISFIATFTQRFFGK